MAASGCGLSGSGPMLGWRDELIPLYITLHVNVQTIQTDIRECPHFLPVVCTYYCVSTVPYRS